MNQRTNVAEVKICTFTADVDLAGLGELLRGQGITYRIERSNYGQDLYADDAYLGFITSLLDRARQQSEEVVVANDGFVAQLRWSVKTWPISFSLICLGVLGFLVVLSEPQLRVLEWFTFIAVGQYSEFLSFAQTYFSQHQWWRLITPTFLHFTWFHLLFNVLALWEFGRRLETVMQWRVYLVMVLFISVGANVVQYGLSPGGLFGGLSGLVYGLIGAIAVLYWRTALTALKLPTGLYIFIFVSLMLGPLGVFRMVFGVNIADGAHFGGLGLGILWALLMPKKWLIFP